MEERKKSGGEERDGHDRGGMARRRTGKEKKANFWEKKKTNARETYQGTPESGHPTFTGQPTGGDSGPSPRDFDWAGGGQ